MAKAKQQARKENRKKKREQQTSQRTVEQQTPVIGSSCTWGDQELSHFRVGVRLNVDVLEMIPQECFDFDHLVDNYKECTTRPRSHVSCLFLPFSHGCV